MGEHSDDTGPHTSPLGLLVARSGRHGDGNPLDEPDRPRRHWPAVTGVVTAVALAGTVGWMFAPRTAVERSSGDPVVWKVTTTPSPGPTVTRTVTRSPTPRVRTQMVTPHPVPAPTVTRWQTRTLSPRPGPTVTRWRTETPEPVVSTVYVTVTPETQAVVGTTAENGGTTE